VGQRWKESCRALERVRRIGLTANKATSVDASFEKASMLDVDLSDADIIFANSVLFTQEMLDRIAKHAEFMKPGAKIISSTGLQGASFKDVSTFSAPTSWSEKTKWKIQEVANHDGSVSLAATGQDRGKPVGQDPAKSCSLSNVEGSASMLDERNSSFRVKLALSIVSMIFLLSVYRDQ